MTRMRDQEGSTLIMLIGLVAAVAIMAATLVALRADPHHRVLRQERQRGVRGVEIVLAMPDRVEGRQVAQAVSERPSPSSDSTGRSCGPFSVQTANWRGLPLSVP